MIRCLPAIVEGPPRLLHCECRRCKNARPIPCPPDDSPNAPQDFIEALLALYDSHYMWATATAAEREAIILLQRAGYTVNCDYEEDHECPSERI